jgi:DNA-binding MarR family transcriptional regulator
MITGRNFLARINDRMNIHRWNPSTPPTSACWTAAGRRLASNQALAEAAHVSPATALRRVRRLVESGVIERQVALLSRARWAA